MKTVLVVACILLAASRADALSLKDYLAMRKSADRATQQTLTLYIHGVEQGVSWANTRFKARYGVSLYCPPAHLVLNPENYMRLIDASIDNPQYAVLVTQHAEEPILGLLLLRELEATFPCEQK